MTRRFHMRSLRNKLFLIIMLISGTTLLLATVAFSVSDKVAARKTLTYIVSSQANIVGQNAAAALTFLDKKAAQEILGGLALQKHIVVARLYDADDRLFAEYTNPSTAPHTSDAISSGSPLDLTSNLMDLYQPVVLDGEQIGTVYVRANLEMLGNRIGNYSKIAGFVMGGLLLLTWLLTSRMHRAITTPLNNVVEIARQVTRNNDYSVRAKKITHDELGELVEGINLMLDQIQSRDNQLAKHAAELEQRVAARTADLEALTEQFRHLAYHDELTGLPNRALFVDRLRKSIAHSERLNNRLAVMFLDLDKFKTINDNLGHAVGDTLLVEVAKRLRLSIRREDSVARLSGDEFTILLNDLNDIETAGNLATKITSALKAPFIIDHHSLQMTASIGISIYPDDNTNLEKLMTYADAAMYKAKIDGRNRYHFYMASLQKEVEHKLAMQRALGNAMEGGEFKIYFKPTIDTKTSKLAGVTAQVHWLSSEFGHLQPEEFLHLMDDLQQSLALGKWLFNHACRQFFLWRSLGLDNVPLSISLTSRQFGDHDLVALIFNTLDDFQLGAGSVQLELEESVITSDALYTIDILESLRKRGISITLKNFGTEKNNFAELIKLPIDAIKLAPSLTEKIAANPRQAAMAEAVIHLAHGLDMKVIAGGVGNVATLSKLIEIGCDQAQGRYLSKSLTARSFEKTYITQGRKDR